MHTNPIYGSGYSQPNYGGAQPSNWHSSGPYAQTRPEIGYGSSQPSFQPGTWHSGPYPQSQSILVGETSQPATWHSGPHLQTQPANWQPGPYPQAPPVIGGGSYSQTESIWQSGPYPQTQSIFAGGNYPQPQDTWQSQTQSIFGGGNYPQAQSTWQLGPYPQTQTVLESGSYPQAQPTWQSGPQYPQTQSVLESGSYPQAQSVWQSVPYPQTQSVLEGGSYPRAQSTWQSVPYPQTQSIPEDGSYPQAQSTWHPQAQPSAASGVGGQPILASIKNDEERIDSAKAISKVERIVDPDSDSSSLCCACRQPIFSTPSISFSHGSDKLFLHEQCASLPLNYLHELHLHQPLVLINQLLQPPQPDATAFNCHNCKEICGTSFYHCLNPSCDFRLDLMCVLQVKIKHRSHNHAMTVIRQRESSSLTCGACNTKHDSKSETLTLSYLCSLCGHWIHPDCASLFNALRYKQHQHPLFLTYNHPTSTDHSICFICSQVHEGSSGVFVCLICTNYLVHINCAVQNPTFEPVLMRDAKASDLGRLPMANEQTSLIPYIRHDITEVNSSSSDGDDALSKIHAHPLIFHETGDAIQFSRVCNACVQYVSPPFYSCSECPDFFLHGCCANLPTRIKHRAHEKHHLVLYPKAPKSDNIYAGFSCNGCHLQCNGFAYSCESCDDFTLDVVCAMINPAITHEPHKSTHILFMSRSIQFNSDEKCNCCSLILNGICYECSICPNFKLHVRCALLPNTVRHVFDQHPLQLTTTAPKESKVGGSGDGLFCEVCEENIEKERWHYSCSECNQWFHIDCIPSIDQLSRIKLGSDVRVDVHGCPVALVRQDDAVCGGSRCGSCRKILKLCDDGLAYECSNCFFGLHQNCAKKHLLKS